MTATEEDSELNAPGVQPLGAKEALQGHGKLTPEGPCLVTPINPPTYSAPVTPAPVYPAPSYGAPTHEAPVYRAPAYQLPTYQGAGQCPGYEAPNYLAPNYPGPTFKAPIYEAPVYEAPSFPVPIFEQPTYLRGHMIPARELSPCAQLQQISPVDQVGEQSGGQSAQELNP
jgi:hypothetical protein